MTLSKTTCHKPIGDRIANYPILCGRTIVLFVLYFTVIMESLIDELHFPGAIRYLNDMAIVIAFIAMLLKPGRAVRRLHSGLLCLSVILIYWVFTLSALLREVDPILYLWATRNTFRGFIFFFACVTYLNREDLPGIFNKLLVLQVVSVALAIYQHFILGLNMDATGGIFGHGNGAGVNTYNALLVAFFLNRYLAGEERLSKFAVSMVSALIIAAVAEEKISYFNLSIIVIISLICSRHIEKIVPTLCISAIVGFIGLEILRTLYPNMFEIISNLDLINEYLRTTSDEGYVLPRIGSFQIIVERFFSDDPLGQLLGVGFGNGETGAYEFLNGPFFLSHGYLHYRWFTHQWVMIECGLVGFCAYLLFFIIIAFKMIKEKISNSDVHTYSYSVMGIGLSLISIISIWYNATLKIDMCYLAFFSLSIGFISLNTKVVDYVQ